MTMFDDLLEIKPTSHPLVSGKILISVPFMGDNYFDKSVILLVEHNNEGSFGIVINKKLKKIPLKFVQSDIKKRLNLYNGGPVEIERLFFLHTYGDLLENNIMLDDGVYFGGKEYDLISLLKADLMDDQNIRFYIGYAGWTSGQLEWELDNNMWIVSSFKREYVFPETENIWQKAVTDLGKNYAHWLQFPDRPYFN